MRTTVGELKKMLEGFSDNTQIVLQVRGNKTTDYSEQEISVIDKVYNYDSIIIIDSMSR